MLTKFGKQVRKYRIDKDMRLAEMAELVGVSSSFLSFVEHGKKDPTEGLVDKIADSLGLDCAQTDELHLAALSSRAECHIYLARQGKLVRETVALFARRIATSQLSKKQLKRIQEFLNNGDA